MLLDFEIKLCSFVIWFNNSLYVFTRFCVSQSAQGRNLFYTSGGVNIVRIEDVIAAFIAAWTKGKEI